MKVPFFKKVGNRSGSLLHSYILVLRALLDPSLLLKLSESGATPPSAPEPPVSIHVPRHTFADKIVDQLGRGWCASCGDCDLDFVRVSAGWLRFDDERRLRVVCGLRVESDSPQWRGVGEVEGEVPVVDTLLGVFDGRIVPVPVTEIEETTQPPSLAASNCRW